eukprot:scaffold216697_cov34-Tisochrysis_lutea.AAC.2
MASSSARGQGVFHIFRSFVLCIRFPIEPGGGIVAPLRSPLCCRCRKPLQGTGLTFHTSTIFHETLACFTASNELGGGGEKRSAAAAMASRRLPRAVCVACGCVGPTVELSSAGKVGLVVASLPHCGCIYRLDDQRPIPALVSVLDGLPLTPTSHCTRTILSPGQPGPDQSAASMLATRGPTVTAQPRARTSHTLVQHSQRPILSVDLLQEALEDGSREIMVYGTAVREEV